MTFAFRIRGVSRPCLDIQCLSVTVSKVFERDSDMSERFLNSPMTKQQIVENVRKMETKNDLLRLLNTIKKEELGDITRSL